MKFYTLIVLLIPFCLRLQGQEIEVIEIRSNDSIVLYGENHSDTEFDVTFYVDYTGFTTKEVSPVSLILAPKVKVKLMTLIAPPGVQCQYKTSLTYKKTKPKASVTPAGGKQRMTGIKLNEKKINVFTQDGCARCEFVISYLEQNKIPFVELNTTIHAPNNDLMFVKLGAAGFNGTSVTMPVVYNNGKVEYNIKDLSNWVKKISK